MSASEIDASSVSDPDLLDRARHGSREAFAILWKRHRALAHAIARPLAHGYTEDVVAEAYTAIWEQVQRGVGPRVNFRAYLLATVRNVSVRILRVNSRVVTGTALDTFIVDDDTHRIEDEESAELVKEGFHKLPGRWQQVLWMTQVEGMSRAEAGDRLGLSTNSTTQLLRRAKEGLRIEWLAGHIARLRTSGHPTVLRQLPRYVRGGWNNARREEIHAHLESCDPCDAIASTVRGENSRIAGVLDLAVAG